AHPKRQTRTTRNRRLLLHRSCRGCVPPDRGSAGVERVRLRDGDRMVRTPRPVELDGPIRTSRAAEFGVSARRVRASDAQHPFHGVTAFGLDLDDLRTRCEAFLPMLLPGQVFSHLTVLALAGCPLPESVSSEIHVSVLFPRTPPRRRGVRGHSLRRLEAVELGGLPVVPP